MHLVHPWVGYGPEIVHHRSDRDQKNDDEQRAELRPVAEKDREAARQNHHARDGDGDFRRRHVCSNRVGQIVTIKMVDAREQENNRKQYASQRTMGPELAPRVSLIASSRAADYISNGS